MGHIYVDLVYADLGYAIHLTQYQIVLDEGFSNSAWQFHDTTGSD